MDEETEFQIKMSLTATSYNLVSGRLVGIQETDDELGLFINGKKYAIVLKTFSGKSLYGVEKGQLKFISLTNDIVQGK